MQKIVLLSITILLFGNIQAQQEKVSRKIDISSRPGDHLMIQLSSDHLTGMPDSINSHQSGFSKGFNAYLMFDKPFKSSPKYSIGIGIGVGTSNIVFKKMNVDIKSLATKLPFTAVDSSNHFKKYKLSLSYLEIPLEFRFSSDPLNANKSWKMAIGLKAGTVINAHTKGKDLQNKNNTLINSYIEKENSKKYFNGTRFMGTARIGYGIFSLFGAYQLNNVLKDVAGPPMKLYQVGITLSGL
ncbi:MAG: PorT family protein [Chitinophagaceae bacterium]|nr:PorT family protein [Chitinophagaceae bacterium]MDB5223020.1 PorT family protein [Chitinophagaceae bacterium]